MNTAVSQSNGFSLIEALIGLVILSVGMLSIASLQGELMSSSGLSKARTEAVQIAEAEMELVRNLITEDQFHAVVTANPRTVNGTNAVFTVNRAVVKLSTSHKRIAVTVSWDDPKEGATAVSVHSIVVWDNPSLGVRAAEGTRGQVSTLSPPTGAARQGSDRNEPYSPVELTKMEKNYILDDGQAYWDGTYTHMRDDGVLELVDAGGNVVLTVRNGEALSKIFGRVYRHTGAYKQGQLPNMADETFVVSSGASFCTRVHANSLLSAGDGFDYYLYQCYVGAGWYGNIGIVRIGTDDLVCVGAPMAVENALLFDSQHADFQPTRVYRGFSQVEGQYRMVGIGMDPITGEYTQKVYPNEQSLNENERHRHDFLLTPVKGQPSLGKNGCQLAMEMNPALFENNAGGGFCFTRGTGGDCPQILDPLP